MSEALDRVVEPMVGAGEDEVAAVIAAVGSSKARAAALAMSPRTLLPGCPGGAAGIVSEVEWV